MGEPLVSVKGLDQAVRQVAPRHLLEDGAAAGCVVLEALVLLPQVERREVRQPRAMVSPGETIVQVHSQRRCGNDAHHRWFVRA